MMEIDTEYTEESISAWISYGDNTELGSLSIHISTTVTLSSKPFRYGIQDPDSRFVGRKPFIAEMQVAIENCQNLTRHISPNDPDLMLLRTLVIVGLHGVGKSQVLRQFLQLHLINHEKNVMWFPGEDQVSLSETLKKYAAAPFSVSTVDADEDLEDVLKIFILKYFCKETILVFDNTESIEDIEPFLKVTVEPPFKLPIIFVTTRNRRNWNNYNLKILDLDSLKPRECKEFIYKQLKSLSDVTTKWEALTKFCRSSPSSLQKAIDVILQEVDLDEDYKIEQYLQDSESLRGIIH